MLYVCARYPACGAYVRTHPGTTIPVGEMANGNLRTLRRTANRYFDQLHQSGYMSKKEAHCWLAVTISAIMSQAHISRSEAFLAARGVGIENKWEANARREKSGLWISKSSEAG